MKTITLTVVSIILVFLGGSSFADWIDNISVEPSDLAASDSVRIIVDGSFSCINTGIFDHSYAVDGQTILIEIVSLQPVICLTAIGSWEVTEEIGPLPVGHYSVVATLRDTSGVIHDSKQSSFSVIGQTLTSRGCVVSRYSPICQSQACSFYLEPDPGYEGYWLCDFSIDGLCIALNLYRFEGCHVEVTGRPGWCSVECGALIIDSLVVLHQPAALSVQDTFGLPGDSIFVNIRLDNAQSIDTLQFLLTESPDVLSLIDAHTTERTAGFTVEFEDISGNISVSIFSQIEIVIGPGIGSILELRFEISPEAVVCDSTVNEVSEAIIADENGKHRCATTEAGTVLVWGCPTIIMGDLNQDCELNVIDVVLLIRCLLEIAPPSQCPLCVLDCNGDGEVNVLDAVGVVNCILGIGTCAP